MQNKLLQTVGSKEQDFAAEQSGAPKHRPHRPRYTHHHPHPPLRS